MGPTPARRPRPPRRIVSLVLPVVLASAVALAAPPADAGSTAGVRVLVVEGRGFGHGVGMAQDGAYWMGVAGASTGDILGQFYPGTGIGQGHGLVRVEVLTPADGETVVTFPAGGEVRSPRDGPQAAGFPIRVEPGGAVRLRHDGSYRAEPLAGATRAASPQGGGTASPLAAGASGRQESGADSATTSSTSTTLVGPGGLPVTTTTTTVPAPPSSSTSTTTTTTTAPAEPPPGPPPSGGAEAVSPSPLWALPAGDGTVGVPEREARYRGVVEATAADGSLRLLNELDVEQYLRGMGEVRDPGWPQASLAAQAIAARTYALRAMVANGELCDSQRCQVYLGQQAEYQAMDRAVAATAGQVLTFGGRLASAVYSANGGGVSATTAEGFGTPSGAHPYLVAAPYPTRDPEPWATRIALADLAPRLGYGPGLESVRVAETGPSGRALTVELGGADGPLVVPALRFAAALGLRSTLWSLRTEEVAVAPPPPEPAELIQDLPGELDAAEPGGEPSGARPDEKAPRRHAHALAAGPVGDRRDPDVPTGVRLALVAVVVAAGAVGARTLRQAERTSPTSPD